MNITLKDAESFFFEAMMQGYVSGIEPTNVFGMPGWKEIPYHRGKWQCLDRWIGGNTLHKSGGVTTISYDKKPVWLMSYMGQYHPETIEFLRRSLMESYRNRKFIGGRGPETFSDSGMTYRNFPDQGHTFANFGGREEICAQANGRYLGEHKYMGMSFLP